MLLVVLFMDMVPAAAFGRYRRPLEGIGAIVFLGLLMTLSLIRLGIRREAAWIQLQLGPGPERADRAEK